MHRWSNRQGFTLVELMVVIAIIGVLVAIAFPVFSRVRETARQTRCRHNMMQLVTALNSYQKANGRYPRAPQLIRDAAGCPDRYVGGFSELYPDYIEDQSLFICPDDRAAKRYTPDPSDCEKPRLGDIVYCSYNGIADWDDLDGDGDTWEFLDLTSGGKAILYNYNGYTYQFMLDPDDPDRIDEISADNGYSSGYDTGPPGITLALILPGGDLDWMDADTNGIPDWLDQAGLSWRHFPALRSNNPPDTTIVTHCYHHRSYFGDPDHALDMIVRLSGETDTANHGLLGDPNETGVGATPVAGWVHQNF